MMKRVNIAILHCSPIVVTGLQGILSKFKSFSPSVEMISREKLATLSASIVVADPLLIHPDLLEEIKEVSSGKVNVVALYTSALPREILHGYDASISIYDTADTIETTLYRLLADEDDREEAKALSQREKDVVIGIVKGLSSKEIASAMGVSVNTVMTHRRNIASKLQIHSAAGLTIYAIVSKLVPLEEIKTRIPQ